VAAHWTLVTTVGGLGSAAGCCEHSKKTLGFHKMRGIS